MLGPYLLLGPFEHRIDWKSRVEVNVFDLKFCECLFFQAGEVKGCKQEILLSNRF